MRYQTALYPDKFLFLERMRGIEPLSLAWKAKVIPLYDIRLNFNINFTNWFDCSNLSSFVVCSINFFNSNRASKVFVRYYNVMNLITDIQLSNIITHNSYWWYWLYLHYSNSE